MNARPGTAVSRATLKLRWLPWIICILGAGYYFYETILEVIPATFVRGMMSSFNIDGYHVGILDMAYFITYAIMQIPGGMMLDSFGARRLMTLAATACFTGLLIFATAHGFALALLGRLIIGFGASFGLMGAMYLVSKWLPRQNLAFYLGLTIMIGLSGGLLQHPLRIMVNDMGWRSALFFLAIIAAYFAVLMWLFLRDKPLPSHKLINTDQADPFKPSTQRINTFVSLWHSCKEVLGQFSNWPIAVYGGLMYIPTGTLGTLWGIEFFKAYYNNAATIDVAEINAMLFLGWIVGSPIVGWLSDRLQRRKPIIIVGAIGALLCLLLMTYLTTLSITTMFIVMFALGLFSSCSGLTFAMASEINPAGSTGTAIGFVNMLAIIPSILSGPLFGYFLDKHWDGAAIKGARIYSFSAFQHAMVIEYIAVASAIVIAWFLVRETYEKFQL